MKKIYLILIASLAIFIVTFELCIHYVERDMEEKAYELNSQIITNLQLELDSRITWTDGGKIQEPERLRHYLRRCLPYGEDYSTIFLMDNDRNILLASDSLFESYGNIDNVLGEWSDDFNRLENHSERVRHFIHHNGNKEFHDYTIFLKNVPWRVAISCDSDAIYEDVRHLRYILWIVSGIGLILMLICGYFIIRHLATQMRQQATLENELNMAARVQMQMLKHPEFSVGNVSVNAFMCPARQAGGDLYDYVVKDNNLLFCVGDVSDKGVSAALFMAEVVSLFRCEARHLSDPKNIMKYVNDVLANDNPSMTFCTMFLGILNLDTYELTYCNAGHNPPALKTASGTSLMTVRPNIALGLMEGFQFQTESIQMHPGDTIVLYSDGITEAKNASHELYGESRMLTAISNTSSPANLITEIKADVAKFVRGYDQSDDITLMTVSPL